MVASSSSIWRLLVPLLSVWLVTSVGRGDNKLAKARVPCWPLDGKQALESARRCCSAAPRDVIPVPGPEGGSYVGPAEVVCFDHVVRRADCCPASGDPIESFDVDLPLTGSEMPIEWRRSPGEVHLAETAEQRSWERSVLRASQKRRVSLGSGLEATVWSYNRAPADPDWGTWPQIRRALDATGARLVIDVGANLGVVAVAVCKYCPQCMVFAMEPFVPNFRYLLWNLRANNCTQRVHALNTAAGSRNMQSLTYNPTCPNQSGAPAEPVRACNVVLMNLPVTEVPLTAAARFFNLTGSTDRVMKLDCEGCEHFLSAHDRAFVRQSSAVVAELHDNHPDGPAVMRRSGTRLCDGPAGAYREVSLHVDGRGEVDVCGGEWPV